MCGTRCCTDFGLVQSAGIGESFKNHIQGILNSRTTPSVPTEKTFARRMPTRIRSSGEKRDCDGCNKAIQCLNSSGLGFYSIH